MNTLLILLPIISMLHTPPDDHSKNFSKMGIDEIRYCYYDSSVPPQYHRSYTITVTESVLSILVDSYGDIISDLKFESSPEQFKKLLDLLDAGKVRNITETKNEGCTGGTGEGIYCLKQSQILFHGKAFYCGNQTTGNLGGKITAFRETIKSMIPDWEKAMNR
jgi:hypothetical protein